MNYAYQREAQTEFFDDRATFARDFTWRYVGDSARHRFNHALTWELPVGRGRWLLKNAAKPVDLALGGWQLTTTNRWYSGRILQFNQNLIANGNPKLKDPTRDRWFDTSVFAALPARTAKRPGEYPPHEPVHLRRRCWAGHVADRYDPEQGVQAERAIQVRGARRSLQRVQPISTGTTRRGFHQPQFRQGDQQAARLHRTRDSVRVQAVVLNQKQSRSVQYRA